MPRTLNSEYYKNIPKSERERKHEEKLRKETERLLNQLKKAQRTEK